MEQFKAFIDSVTNNPTFIALLSTGVVGIIAGVIFKKTSFGKKALISIKDGFSRLTTTVNQGLTKYHELETEIKQEKEKLETKYADFKKDSENKIAAVYLQYTSFKDDVFKVLEQIPNAKVQAQVQELKVKAEEKESEVKVALGGAYEEVNNKLISRYNDGIEKLNQENADLKGELANIKQILDKIQNSPIIDQLTPKEEDTDDGEEE